MPKSGAKSHTVNNGKTVQSAWFTHWTGSEMSKHDHSTQIVRSRGNDLNDHGFKNHLSGVEMASDNFGSSKGIKDTDLTMSLMKPGSQSFPFFKRAQESGKLKEGVQALGPQVSNEKLTLDFNLETSSRESHLQPAEQVKYHMFFGDSSYKVDSHTNHEPENYHHPTAAFASKPKSEKSEMTSFLRQNNTAVLKAPPSTSSHHSPAVIEDQSKRMQKHVGSGFFPHLIGSPQYSKSQTLHHGQYSLQNVPHFVNDVEVARMPGGLHSFSRTTHSLLITKQTDIKVYQESQYYRESRVSTQFKGEAFNEPKCSHPYFGQSQQGVKLQLLNSSDHESHENAEDYGASGDVQKNESSADTDTMDMESFKENHLSGKFFCRHHPYFMLTFQDIMVESNIEKDKCRKRKIELPDMNLEISAQPAASSSTDKAEPGTSRTQSLDMNTLHLNLDQSTNSNSNSISNSCSNSNPDLDPGSRWIKRLKLSETPSSHGRLSRFFTTVRVMEGIPESVLDKNHGKGSESEAGDSSSAETRREGKDITLSHSWIQRWSHKKSQKNPETAGTCQPDNPKSEMEELQKKQFPSIAAMALMGKAMTGFKQFKLQKKESFVVWNTKAIE
ncbi:hypothetical protein SSX86_005657 [Deinandra increscens subsp. villosa]|uniref:F-box protein n=1 Tax=Deinandra increscens subsp. villosa TaxID=3103831 RepID=A0AAP0DLM6_9ASTR